MQRRAVVQRGVAAAAMAALPGISVAQTWPAKPLRLVVPFPPGGTTDGVTRLIALELGKALRQAVIVENKPGAGTVIGVDAVAKSAPDGYSLVTVANSFCVNQTLVNKLPYDGLKDLRPVALMGMSAPEFMTRREQAAAKDHPTPAGENGAEQEADTDIEEEAA